MAGKSRAPEYSRMQFWVRTQSLSSFIPSISSPFCSITLLHRPATEHLYPMADHTHADTKYFRMFFQQPGPFLHSTVYFCCDLLIPGISMASFYNLFLFNSQKLSTLRLCKFLRNTSGSKEKTDCWFIIQKTQGRDTRCFPVLCRGTGYNQPLKGRSCQHCHQQQ